MKYIIGYKKGLHSVREIAKNPEIHGIRVDGSRFRARSPKIVINWGASVLPPRVAYNRRIINYPDNVQMASNKLLSFRMWERCQLPHVPFTQSIEEARGWSRKGKSVVCRTLLRASGGRGIVLAETEAEIVDAPLYTKYLNSSSEWRVHVFGDECILVQRKVRNPELPVDTINWKIRNHLNGFIFQQNNPDVPPVLLQTALSAVFALGLHFGAVDLLYRGKENKAYILEVNCAPNLEGSSVEKYTNAIINL